VPNSDPLRVDGVVDRGVRSCRSPIKLGVVQVDRDALQKLAWIASNPSSLYGWIKLIDGDPRPGASQINGHRVVMFCDLRDRQIFYEAVSSHEALLRALQNESLLTDLALPSRHTINVAFELFPSADHAPLGRLPMPSRGEPSRGLHSVRVVGWEDDGETLVFRNSWGASWGNKGYGTFSRAYLDQFMRDAWVRQSVRQGRNLIAIGRLASASTRAEQRAALETENPRRRRRVKLTQSWCEVVRYEAFSIECEAAAEVIELKSAVGLRLGWAMLVHDPAGVVRLCELFVWPSFRRRGFGTLLEETVVERTRTRGATRIVANLYGSDTVAPGVAPGLAFGLARGYRWTRARKVPPVALEGDKAL
jgi:GNAT superfamily N-acetyltransferase